MSTSLRFAVLALVLLGATVARATEIDAVDPFGGPPGDGRAIHGLTSHRALHFTFDDGPSEHTPRLLDILDAHHVRATFFLVAQQLEHPRGAAIAREIVRRGHTVGLHSYRHDDVTALGVGGLGVDLDRSEAAFVSVFGARPHLYRPPYGRHDDTVDATLAARGYTEVLWNITAGDGSAHTADGVATAFSRALDAQTHISRGQGGVVILHDTHSWIVDAVPAILDGIDARNCNALANGEELWDVRDDLSAWYEPRGSAPATRAARRMHLDADTFAARQSELRTAAEARCPTRP
jgi:peptidoglycan/xylan/chitin deacetylase (PgdA/CDA1 family)